MPNRPKVTIRPLQLDDAASVHQYAADPLVSATTNIPVPYPENGGEMFVQQTIAAREKREGFPYAILADDEFVGVVGLNRADFKGRSIQCDYAIASTHWGRGITTRAVALALQVAFEELHMQVVHSSCLDRNAASKRVLEKNGFTETGRFVLNSRKFTDEPAVRYRLTRSMWRAGQ